MNFIHATKPLPPQKPKDKIQTKIKLASITLNAFSKEKFSPPRDSEYIEVEANIYTNGDIRIIVSFFKDEIIPNPNYKILCEGYKKLCEEYKEEIKKYEEFMKSKI